MSYADFYVYEWLFIARLFAPEILEQHSNLLSFLQRIEQLPRVAEFIRSDKHIAFPISAVEGVWGNSKSTPELEQRVRRLLGLEPLTTETTTETDA